MAKPPLDAPQPGQPDGGDPRQPGERRGPYEILERKKIHEKFGMTVESVRVRTPDGTVREILPVSFPREATLMALTSNGSILGSREPVYGTNEVNFEFAGGVKGEGTVEEAAMAKVQDELGVTPHAASIINLASIRSDSPFLWNVTHQSIADVRSRDEGFRHPTITHELIPAENIRSSVLRGDINTANIAVQALLIADALEAQGRQLPQVETLRMPGGRWVNERPSPWRLVDKPATRNGQRVDQRGGYDVLERKIMHTTESKDVQLVHDRIRKTDGSEGDQYFLTYPRQIQLAMVDETGQVYLKREHSYAYDEPVVGLPGSAILDGETYGQATQRLIQQELGKPGRRDKYDLGEWGETTSRMDYKTRIVAVRVKKDEMQAKTDYEPVTVDEGWERVKAGKIKQLTPALTLSLLKQTKLA